MPIKLFIKLPIGSYWPLLARCAGALLAPVSKLDLGSVRDWTPFSRNWINELYEVPFTEALLHWAAVSGRQRYGYLPDGFDAHGSTLLENEDEKGDNVGPKFDCPLTCVALQFIQNSKYCSYITSLVL